MQRIKANRKLLALFLAILGLSLLPGLGIEKAQGAVVFSDGFAGGNFNNWTDFINYPAKIRLTNVRSYDDFFCLSATAYAGYIGKNLASSYSTLYGRIYVYFSSLPASDGTARFVKVITLGPTNTQYASVYFGRRDTAGSKALAIWVFNDHLGTSTQVNYAWSASTWYCLDLMCIRSATVGEIQVWINGASVYAWTGIDTGDYNLQRIETGFRSGSSGWSVTINVDDVVVSTTAIGPETIGYTTIRFTSLGVMGINGTFPANGTVYNFNGDVLNLEGLANTGKEFLNFKIDATNQTGNPYQTTISANSTLWAYFKAPPSLAGNATASKVLQGYNFQNATGLFNGGLTGNATSGNVSLGFTFINSTGQFTGSLVSGGSSSWLIFAVLAFILFLCAFAIFALKD